MKVLIIELFWRVAFLFLPSVSEAALASQPYRPSLFSNETIRNFSTLYSDVILITSCIVLMIFGLTIGYFFPTPKYGAKPFPKPIKLMISVFGGVLAFVYYVHTEKNITPAVIIWVAGVSFVFPAIIHLFHAAAIKITGSKVNITDQDLKDIESTFRKED